MKKFSFSSAFLPPTIIQVLFNVLQKIFHSFILNVTLTIRAFYTYKLSQKIANKSTTLLKNLFLPLHEGRNNKKFLGKKDNGMGK